MSTQATLLNTSQWTRFARSWAGSVGCSLRYVKDHPVPSYNLTTKVITVRPPEFAWTQEQANGWFGEILHEIGHADFREAPLIQKIIDEGIHPSTQLFQVINIVNDYEHEHRDNGLYKGRDKALSVCQGLAAKEGATVIQSGTIPDTQDMKERVVLFAWYYNLRSDWQLDVDASEWTQDYSILEEFSSEMNALRDKCPSECYDLALRILAKLHGSTPEQEEEQAKQESAEAEAKESQGEPQPGSEEQQAAGKMLAHEHGGIDDKDNGGSIGRKGASDSDGPPSAVRTVLNDDEGEFDFPGTKLADIEDRPNPGFSEVILDGAQKCSSLYTQLRRLLQVRSQSKYSPGFKRGRKLHLKSVVRNRTDPTHLSVYKRKTSELNLDNSVFLLIDGSGSMHGQRYACAASAAVAMYAALQPLNIRTEVGIHTDSGSRGEEIYIPTRFGSRASKEELASKLAAHSKFDNNSDGSALMYAMDRVLRQDTAGRTIIVLSDGQPAAAVYGDDREFLRRAISTAECAGVSVYGIGIQSNAVQNYYPNRTVVNNVEELPKALLNVLTESLVLSD